jgi:hypothetical protein
MHKPAEDGGRSEGGENKSEGSLHRLDVIPLLRLLRRDTTDNES